MSACNRELGIRGFTLLEACIAIFILAVGLLSAVLMGTQMMMGTQTSKIMSTAAVLASEKLEDLNRWDAGDPSVCVPSGASVGSLTSDVMQTTTCSDGESATVAYYDNVSTNITNTSPCPSGTTGCFAETVSGISGSSTSYITTTHAPTGVVQMTTSTSAPAGENFHRRWIIEANEPVSGVRRLTVLVTSNDPSINPQVSFQMSIVRP